MTASPRPEKPNRAPGSSLASKAAPGSARNAPPPARQRHFFFLLLDQFTLLSFAAAIEPLRIANRMSGQELYRWTLLSENGAPVQCSNGALMSVDAALPELARDDVVMVCAGIDVRAATTQGVINWLRKVSRKGSVIGGLCTGAHVLAQAGLLDSRRATIHWENQDGFAEKFPDVTLIRTVFVEDGNRLTAAGGTAAIDLMLRQIARDHGAELASRVADQMIHTAIRSEEDQQRLSSPGRIGAHHPRLAQVLARMEANIEDPVSPARLAAEAGLSPRQLERLFARHLGRSPKRYYMELRLERARHLLLQTPMSVMEIALACGFASAVHFSKCYRATYGCTPYRERGAAGAH